MPSIPLYPRPAAAVASHDNDDHVNSNPNPNNPLPPLLQTPSGLAILELQGTINIPAPTEEELARASDDDAAAGAEKSAGATFETEIGKLMFPDYSPLNPDDTKWMKKVYLYAGRYQRMTGEVKKLTKPLAVIRRRQKQQHVDGDQSLGKQGAGQDGDELEIVEIIKYKILFPSRPEPVGFE